MGNKFLVGILFVVVGVLVGVSLLVSISVAINTTMAPMAGKLHDISVSQRNIEDKVSKNLNPDNMTNLLNRLAVLESKLTALEQRGVRAQGQDAPTPQMPQQAMENLTKRMKFQSASLMYLVRKMRR